MKKIIPLLGTTLLLAAVGLTTTIATAVSANAVSAKAQATPEKPLDEEEVAASTQSEDDPITGDWDASVEAGGEKMHFALHLKLEGDKVTGSSESEFGSTTIIKGRWDGNTLKFSVIIPDGVIYANSVINWNAVLKEGKLVGEFDFVSQFTGKWEAKKK